MTVDVTTVVVAVLLHGPAWIAALYAWRSHKMIKKNGNGNGHKP